MLNLLIENNVITAVVEGDFSSTATSFLVPPPTDFVAAEPGDWAWDGTALVRAPALVLARNKTQRKADLAALRYQHETDGIVINSANDMAVKPGVAYQSVAGYVQACFMREKELSAALDAATTLEELNSIDLAVGWPA